MIHKLHQSYYRSAFSSVHRRQSKNAFAFYFIVFYAKAVIHICSSKQVFLKISQISQENTFTGGLQASNYIKKSLRRRCFPVKFAKFFGTPFFTEHIRWPLLSCMSSLKRSLNMNQKHLKRTKDTFGNFSKN